MKKISPRLTSLLSFPAKSLLLSGCVLMACFSPLLEAQAQVVFQDDFESYADQAALSAVWINNSAGAAAGLPDGEGVVLTNSRSIVPDGGIQSGRTLYAHESSYVTLPETIPATTPFLATFYMWRDSVSTTEGQTRNYVRFGPNSFAGSAFGAGWFNNATAPVNGVEDTFKGTNYQGFAIALGSMAAALFNLSDPGCPLRTPGWHKFDVERQADGSTRYYVDNVLGRTITNASPDVQFIIAGFGNTSGTPPPPGEEVDYDGVTVITNNPTVDTQPTNIFAATNSSASFSVGASGSPTGYQWYFGSLVGGNPGVIYNTNYFPISGNNISGQNSDTLVINPVRSTNAGYYFVIVTNENGSIGSAAARLTLGAPSVSAGPTSQEVLQGATAIFNVQASGVPPLGYQWQFNSNNILGATASSYTNNNVQPANAGYYRCVVSNSISMTPSTNALLTVIPAPNPDVMSVLWRIVPGTNGWLNAGGSAARGLAYNALANHVLVATRAVVATGEIRVLDADTGTELYTMNTGSDVISGGTQLQSKVGVADDGAVYVCNLTLTAGSSPFKIYRYADDGPATVPELVYSGDPGSGSPSERWGDTMDVRGSGAGTEILVGSRAGTNFAVITNFSGIDPAVATLIKVTTTNNSFGLGLAFGAGNTFWAKVNGGVLRQMNYSGTILNVYPNFSLAVTAIGVDPANNFLAGNAFETPDNLRLYDISNLAANPPLLDFEFYANPKNTGFGTGAIDLAPNRVYALDENNGIIAWQVIQPPLNFSVSGSNLILNWTNWTSGPPFTLQCSTNVTGPYATIAGATSPYTNSTAGPPSQKFFILKR